MIPIRPPSGVPSPAGPTSTAPSLAATDHRIGPLLWRALRRRRRTRRARARPRRPVRHGRRLPHGGAAPHPPRRGAGGAPADRRRSGAGRLQGSRGGGALPRARAAPHGGHRPPAPPPRSPARPQLRWVTAGWRVVRAGGGDHYDTVLRPRRRALPLPRTALRARGHVTAGDGTRPGRAVGPPPADCTAPARPPSGCRWPTSWSCWPRTPANPTTASCGWCGSPTWP